MRFCKLTKTIVISCLIILILFFLHGRISNPADGYTPVVRGGVLDLTNYDFDKYRDIDLDGQWEFYWEKLLTYEDFANEKVQPDLIEMVPKTWTNYKINDEKLSGTGYATYRLHIKTKLKKDSLLAFRIYNFSSAYRFYINEKLIAFEGNVSTNPRNEIGGYRPKIAVFNVPSSDFDIIIQVSNFHYASGGFWYRLYMGSLSGITRLNNIAMGKEIFLLGALIIISLFYLAIYILNREFKYALYFSIFCMAMALVVDMVGQFMILGVLPGMSLDSVIFIWYSSTLWVLYVFLLYLDNLFPSKFSRIVLVAYLAVAAIVQILYALTPTVFYTGFGHMSNYIQIAFIACTVIVVGLGIKRGQKGALANIIGIFILLIAYIHDTFYWMNIIRSDFGEIIYFGLFFFMLIQMVVQAQRIRLYHDNKTAAEMAFLQSQIKPHFLYNALNTIISISRYDADRARETLLNFSNYLRRSFDFKDLSQFVPVKNEIVLARAYVEIEKARFEERLDVTFDIDEDLDCSVPTLILQPMVENAVIHGILPKPEGGKIRVSIKKDDKYVTFKVSDNGKGMDEKRIKSILKEESKNGVGVSNVNKRLKRLYGRGIEIKSTPGIGTDIIWSIPLQRR